MVNWPKAIYSRGLNQGFSSKFRVGYRVRYETPKECRRMHRPKRCKYNNKYEDNSLNTLNDKGFTWFQVFQSNTKNFTMIIESRVTNNNFINWITMTRKTGKHLRAIHGTIGLLFRPFRSHQQCIPWSPPLEIELETRECRAETLPLSYWSKSHTVDAKLTNHGKCAAN